MVSANLEVVLSIAQIVPFTEAEGPGVQAIAEGFRHLGFADDHAVNAAEWIVYDALYAYCREMVRRGKPAGQFAG